MLRGKTISLIIPCKNEETAIVALLKRVPGLVDEVIVVDNNSTDKTSQVAKKMWAKVVTETRQINDIGYGFAHQKGMEIATGDFIITLDGDNTYPVEAVESVIRNMMENKLDMVSCNRFPLKYHQSVSKIRQLGVWILNTEVAILYGYPIQDILSGMWAINRKAIKHLQLECGGWNLSPEIKLQAIVNPHIQFGEYHINHAYRNDGVSKQQIWLTGFEHLRYILVRRLTKDNKLMRKLKAALLLNVFPRLSLFDLNR